MKQCILLPILVFLYPLAVFSDKQKGNGPIDFSKEAPVHPFYESYSGNGNMNCKEKQECMSNCTSSVYVYTNRGNLWSRHAKVVLRIAIGLFVYQRIKSNPLRDHVVNLNSFPIFS